MIEVLIMDASAGIRGALKELIESDGSLRVVGSAKNAQEGLTSWRTLRPDLVVMDIRLSGMNDFDLIDSIMADVPCPIVGLSDVPAGRDFELRKSAETAGALIVLDKPKFGSVAPHSASQFLRSLRGMSEIRVVRRTRSRRPVSAAGTANGRHPTPRLHVDLLAIGASTGGPPAIQSVLLGLTRLTVPVVVVQHISDGFVRGLSRWLDETTPHTVKLAEDGEILRKGVVYLAPDDNHLVLRNRTTLALNPEGPVGGHRPSVDVLFDSVAAVMGNSAAAVLLTGMGRDGAKGLLSLRQRGGHTLAQDEDSCVVFGMPGEAVAIGAAEIVSPLVEIADHVLRWLP